MTKEMSKLENWFNRSKRTIKSRGITLTGVEMETGGILEIVNVTSAIDEQGGGRDQQEDILRQGLSGRPVQTTVLIESAVRGVKTRLGDTAYMRVYTGIVFADEYCMHLFALRNKDMYRNLNDFSRLVN